MPVTERLASAFLKINMPLSEFQMAPQSAVTQPSSWVGFQHNSDLFQGHGPMAIAL